MTVSCQSSGLNRTSRFVALAQKTGLSFTDIDHILRHCCQVNDVPTLSTDTLVYIAQVVYIHKTLEQPIDTVIAILSKISYVGRTNEDLPQDQFNRIFNLPCVSIDEKYFTLRIRLGSFRLSIATLLTMPMIKSSMKKIYLVMTMIPIVSVCAMP